jgi:hypothetical protein
MALGRVYKEREEGRGEREEGKKIRGTRKESS